MQHYLPRFPTIRTTKIRNYSIMHQAVVTQWGQAPKYTEVADLPAPAEGEVRIKVLAAGAHRVVLSRAAGQHYSSGPLPHVPGIDGVGKTDDGKTVYFSSFDVGSFSEYVNMDKRRTIPVPDDLDPVQVAGVANPAMSSWMAMKTRTNDLPKDFSVLVVGATSASGRAAIPLARALGAKKVLGAARSKEALEKLGLDEAVVIAEDPKQTDFAPASDVNVILDYVGGDLTSHLFASLKSHTPIQYVHVGGLSGSDAMSFPGSILRSKNLTIRGSGPGAWSMQDAVRMLPDMIEAMRYVPEQPMKKVKLEDVEKEWNVAGGERLVFIP
jgi:NADPH:quinone reductase-like Zn-dependent oxidoreductase